MEHNCCTFSFFLLHANLQLINRAPERSDRLEWKNKHFGVTARITKQPTQTDDPLEAAAKNKLKLIDDESKSLDN